MTEKPILFSGPMVRAILSGSKTQTRRVLKPQPRCASVWQEKATGRWLSNDRHGGDEYIPVRWAPGDSLWVREVFSGPHECADTPPGEWRNVAIWYWADGNPEEGHWTKPKPSIHMPRWASRITLAVTGVRVERLQSISEADALAEGMRAPYLGDGDPPYEEIPSMIGPVQQFRNLWNTINGPGAWDANPYVCMIEFRRMEDKQP